MTTMIKQTGIEWADFSWSPWWGCTKVSPGCVNCYAARWALWTRGIKYAKGEARVRVKDWRRVRKIHSHAPMFMECARCGWRGFRPEFFGCDPLCAVPARPRVFPSMMDWLDAEVPVEMLAEFLRLIYETPGVDWLLLTKRPELFRERVGTVCDYLLKHATAENLELRLKLFSWMAPIRSRPEAPANVWVGATVEDQERANVRVPAVLEIPAVVRFLSVEPMVGPVDLHALATAEVCETCEKPITWDILHATCDCACCCEGSEPCVQAGRIDWVIVGGESGAGARPMHPEWARGVVEQCQGAEVAVFFKQWGEWVPIDEPAAQNDVAPLAKNERWMNVAGGQGFHGEQVWRMRRVGKKADPKTLDGLSYREWPAAVARQGGAK